MKRSILTLILLLALAAPALATQYAVIETNRGNIKLELYDQKAPVTVKNFLSYAEKGFYNGTIFHRVIRDFMIQGGGYTTDLVRKETAAPIKNEADNGLKNKRGTIAMARTSVIDSATSQFFINLKDNDFLDHRGSFPGAFGYAVFGKVVEGMDVVDAIGPTPVERKNAQFQNLPKEPVIIRSIKKVGK
ncbi:MAG: peptidylprolyl isomerase [Desulfuromonadales bacterium]